MIVVKVAVPCVFGDGIEDKTEVARFVGRHVCSLQERSGSVKISKLPRFERNKDV